MTKVDSSRGQTMMTPRLRSRLYPSWRPTVFFALFITKATAFVLRATTPTAFYHGLTSSNIISNRKHKVRVALSASEEPWDVNDGKSSGALGKPAYNDNALFNFHMMTQAQKIRDYSAMDTYVDTNSLWNLAWHDSFVRNGLSDFVPPLTDSLNVLVVGDRYRGPTGEGPERLPDDERPEGLPIDATVGVDDDAIAAVAAVVSAPSHPIEAATEEDTESAEEPNHLQRNPQQDSSCSFLAAVFDCDEDAYVNNSGGSGSALDLESYDCIMDQGLISDLCSSTGENSNMEDVARLLYEATKRIRDGGIYVANTPPLSSETKEYLTTLGQTLGLQWVFDMDGISDEKLSVSVARKYFNKELPPGWQSFWSRGLKDEP